MSQSESLKQYSSVYIIIIALCVVATIYRPGYFDATNIYMMLRQAAALGIISMGHLFVVTAGGSDLSVDATMKISMVVIMLFYNNFGEQWILAGIIAALAISVILGAINGFIISRFNVTAFLVTIFTGVVFDGLRRMFTGISPMGSTPPQIAQLVKGEEVGAIPYAAYILLAVTVVAYIVMNRTVFGRKLMLVGNNPTAADLSGIRVRRMVFITYLITGGAAVLAALVVAGYTGYVDQETLGTGMGFASLIAVILGGNMWGEGKPTVIGTLGGALAATLILNFVVLFGFQIQHQHVFKGFILIMVILVSSYVRNRTFTLGNFDLNYKAPKMKQKKS